ncbi:hypothetical protein BCR39DRAFT_556268 [Naematelia encephala]|uniref:Cytochrome c oxidase assembly protein COX20, mitochondrial n=1 Tax=Naematelia encephala TaxID=71784 RepID=A0A1Y2BIZ7_9TREE|nr:hypothetical protein BCR39DRAFT_556268 [Naematelia encephala]
MPAGRDPVNTEPTPIASAEPSSSSWTFRDLKLAASQIRPLEDFQNLGKVPCMRTSLLYGIGGGSAIGAIRFIGTRRPVTATLWAYFSFVGITVLQWTRCRTARQKELQTMKMIKERFPDRHATRLRQEHTKPDVTSES